MTMSPAFLISGSTGQQGGAVARLLLKQGYAVHALVRDPSSPAAQALETAGARLFHGGFDDFPVIAAATAGCTGVFMNLYPTFDDPFRQVSQARNFIKAAREAQTVTTFVVSTSFWAKNPERYSSPDLPKDLQDQLNGYYQIKASVEDLVHAAGFENVTIIRPSFLMHNYLKDGSAPFFPELSKTGELCHAYTPSAKMPHFAASDIGKFGAGALTKPEVFSGKEIELGFENLTMEEVHRSLEKVSGKKIPIRVRSEEEVVEKTPVIPSTMFFALASLVDLSIDGTGFEKEFGIKPLKFEEFLRENEEELTKSLGP
jgi:uncharacterized protein YbjT (DUF2867 family)